MYAETPQHRSELAVIGENRAAVAVAAERLCGKKARCRGRRHRAQAPVPVCRTEGLRCIVKNKQPFGLCGRGNALMIGGLAEEIDGDHRSRIEGKPARDRARAAQAVWIEVKACLLDVS